MSSALSAIWLLASACAPLPAEEKLIAGDTDPAVDLANAMAGEPDAYSEGYLGEGNDLIHYVEAGEGQPIIFVHGFPSFWYLWHDQMEALRKCRRVIAIDAPGANKSARPADTQYYRLENLADRLEAVIAELSPNEKVTLVGHDWGGALAWSYAERDASRLDRLVIFSAPPFDLMIELLANDQEQQARSAYMERFQNITLSTIKNDGIHESLFELAYGKMIERGILDQRQGEVFKSATADPIAVNAGMDWYRANVPKFSAIDPATHAWPSADASADVPTLLIRGSKDQTFVKHISELAQAHASSLDVKVIENVAHWTPFEDPEAANRLLLDFIEAPAHCSA